VSTLVHQQVDLIEVRGTDITRGPSSLPERIADKGILDGMRRSSYIATPLGAFQE